MPKLLRANGGLTNYRTKANYFYDDFVRDVPADTVVLLEDDDRGWVDFTSFAPTKFDPVGLLNGYATTGALTRSAAAGLPYSPDPPDDAGSDYLNYPGTIIPGICGAYRETGSTKALVEILWGANHDSHHHTEATPAMCVVPGTGRLTLGNWPSGPVIGTGLWIVGCIGDPPEAFGDYEIDGLLEPLPDGEQFWIGIATNDDATAVKLYKRYPGEPRQQLTLGTHGNDWVPIPAELQGSTKHGFCIDQHMVDYQDASTPSLANLHAAAGLHAIQMTLM